jgi:DNA-binding phage protein
MSKGHEALRAHVGTERGAKARLSRESGIGQDVLSRILERGQDPSLPTAAAIERVTGIPAVWFAEPSESEPTDTPAA